MTAVSIVVPTYNEEGNVQELIRRIDTSLVGSDMSYEIIFVDDNSTDNTRKIIQSFTADFPVSLYIKDGEKGKAHSLLQGFSHVTYDIVCMIDADLQYPPEAIPEMIKKINEGTDIVVANRKDNHVNALRKLMSKFYVNFFGLFLHHLTCDVQSGLKVFRKEIVQRIQVKPTPWTFDLEFLIKARHAGYTIDNIDISFQKRSAGKSKVSIIASTLEIALRALQLKFSDDDIIPFLPEVAAKEGKGFHYRGKKYVHHTDLDITQSAVKQLSAAQRLIGIFLCILLIAAFVINWHLSLVVFVATITMYYFSDFLFNLFLIFRSFAHSPEIHISTQELANEDTRGWPVYTIFCPLYKEWQVIPQFITAISKLDYPKEKLQVMLLLEQDDTESIAHIKNYDLPAYFDVVVVPHSLPKTKPKAMNYGLLYAKGEYVVIYDAEDVPDPLQLKKAVIAFQKLGEKTICIQAKLNFYNPHQNLLTRIFTAEYSLWFDLTLTGLQSIHAPIPLGGTSNHFRMHDIKHVHGWDAFNVTEDCDLGMRLAKLGYHTAIIDSVTLEEANSDLKNWFLQRTRWIKGYVQTYLVHMRNPLAFATSWNRPDVVSFQFIVGGKILAMLINPLLWIVTIAYFAFRTKVGLFIESFYPAPILYMGTFSLVMGNFLYMYYYMIGCAKRKQFGLIKYALVVPLYWLYMSAAAWVAVWKMIYQPYYWAKTKHGLHLKNQSVVNQVQNTLGAELVDRQFAVTSI